MLTSKPALDCTGLFVYTPALVCLLVRHLLSSKRGLILFRQSLEL